MLRLAAWIMSAFLILLAAAPPASGSSSLRLPQACVSGRNENGDPCAAVTKDPTAGQAQTTRAPSGSPTTPVRVCTQRVGNGSETQPVECLFQGGWWIDEQQCYVKAMNPPLPFTDGRWLGHTDGAVYMCVALGADATYTTSFFWSQTVPPGLPYTDPRVLAEQALAALQLRPIRMGMVPEDKPGYVGLVGMPVWMWVDAPDPHTYGPATNTASDGSVTVTINAKVAKTLWEMGDGKSVTCNAAGTAYQDSDGKKMSPDCGYSYTKQGTYTIRATTTWDIAWTANTGQSGTIPLTLTATRTVVIGEVQVIVH